MDVRIINPFVEAVCHGVQTMTGVEVTRGQPFVDKEFGARADISGIIGLAGEVTGAVILSFPRTLAKQLFEAMIGEVVEADNPGITDAVGELANITAGGAKKTLEGLGMCFRISVPTVASGEGHRVHQKADGPCLVIPFEGAGHAFWLQVAMKPAA